MKTGIFIFKNSTSQFNSKWLKKLEKLKTEVKARHLGHGLDFFVAEVGQCRICFKQNDKNKTRRLYFVGDHKDYEKWLKEQ